jgi:hypothetical protein
MNQPSLHPLSFLHGREVVGWAGTEMAVNGGSESNVWNESKGQWQVEHEQVEWSNPSVRYLQFTNLDIHLACGKTMRLLSQLDDGTGFYGLYLMEVEQGAKLGAEESWSICRPRELPELPHGLLNIEVLRRREPNAAIEANITIANDTINILAAEVHPRADGRFDIVEGDESLLIQLNGARPSLLIQVQPNE